MSTVEMLLTIIGSLGGVTGIIWFVYFLANKKRKITWIQVENGIKELVTMINRDNFKPDLVVGLSRSGAIVGGMIAGNLGLIPVICVDRQYTWDYNNRHTHIISFGEIDIKGKRILAVDGRPRTGETLKLLREWLLIKEPMEIKTASLMKTKIATYIADYYVYEVEPEVAEKVPWKLMANWYDDSRKK